MRLPVSFTGDHNGEGLLTNLSLSGCRLEQPNTLIDQDAILALSFCASLRIFSVNINGAVVRWTKGPACGVEFFDVDHQAQCRLERYIAEIRA